MKERLWVIFLFSRNSRILYRHFSLVQGIPTKNGDIKGAHKQSGKKKNNP